MNPLCPSHHSVGVAVMVRLTSSISARPRFAGWSIIAGEASHTVPFPARFGFSYLKQAARNLFDRKLKGPGNRTAPPGIQILGDGLAPIGNAGGWNPYPGRTAAPEISTGAGGWPAANPNVVRTRTGFPSRIAGWNFQPRTAAIRPRSYCGSEISST